MLQNYQISTKLVHHNEELGHSTMTLWGENKEEFFWTYAQLKRLTVVFLTNLFLILAHPQVENRCITTMLPLKFETTLS